MKLSRLAALAVVAGLAACSAGRGGGPVAPAAVPRNPAPAAAASAGMSAAPAARRTPGPASSAGATPAAACSLAPDARVALAHINRLRADGADCRGGGRFGPAPALAWNAALLQAAAAHSHDMAAHEHFSHTGSDGSTMAARVAAAGYGWLRIGENIGAGPVSAEAAVAMWMGSDGHCANLMNPDFRDAALACATGAAGNAYGTYWTLELGRSR